MRAAFDTLWLMEKRIEESFELERKFLKNECILHRALLCSYWKHEVEAITTMDWQKVIIEAPQKKESRFMNVWNFSPLYMSSETFLYGQALNKNRLRKRCVGKHCGRQPNKSCRFALYSH
jgi:hypothetical protein